jgi:hypothetical protein
VNSLRQRSLLRPPLGSVFAEHQVVVRRVSTSWSAPTAASAFLAESTVQVYGKIKIDMGISATVVLDT